MPSTLKVPPLVIDSVEGEIVFEKGVGKVTRFEAKSKDFALGLEGMITLADSLSESQNDLYLTFKILKGYIAKSPAIKTLVATADTFSSEMKRAHREDDFYGFRYRGSFGKGRFTPAKEFKLSQKGANPTGNDKKNKKRKKKKSKRRPERSLSTPEPRNRGPEVSWSVKF